MKTMELLPPTETMFRALVNRDSSFEGIFFVGVRTTGIFCRPTCSAKKPARENVDFFATSSEALESGYRPCLRCHPMDPNQRAPKLIERLRIEVERAPDGRLTDKELTGLAIDPSTARRQFKRHYGHEHMQCRERMGVSNQSVGNWPIISPSKTASSIFHGRQLVRSLNCGPGKFCSRSPQAKHARIPGWRNAWQMKTRAGLSAV